MTNRTDPAAVARPILAIETGGRACSVAIVSASGAVLAQESAPTDHGHATMLMPMIERVRTAAGLGYAELGRIAVAIGPGSFTGLRVGLAAAQGLALAANIPVIGISSFLTVVPKERDGMRLIVVLDSRREEPFFAEIDPALRFQQPPAVVSPEALDAIVVAAGPAIVTGDAPALERFRDKDALRLIVRAPSAVAVAALAADPEHRYDLPPKPVYVRAPDVTMPKTA